MTKILEVCNLVKIFNNRKVLDDFNFDLNEGEVHAILGENGSGKSTFVNILAGNFSKDEGEIYLYGNKVEIESPVIARKLGMSFIFQNSFLYDNRTVAENILSNDLPSKGIFHLVNKKLMNEEAANILNKLEFPINPFWVVRDLNLPQKRMVEIAKALSKNAKILIMDEPVSSISYKECNVLFDRINHLKDNGISIIYISQRLQDIEKIADRVTMLSDGKVVFQGKMDGKVMKDVIAFMSQNSQVNRYPRLDVAKGKQLFCVKKVSSLNGSIRDIDLSLHAGEAIGITGLIGSGREELGRLLVGRDKKGSGTFYVHGKKTLIKSPKDALEKGIAYVADDRIFEGLYINLKISNNLMSIRHLKSRKQIIRLNKEKLYASHILRKMKMNLPAEFKIHTASGGNQQKIMLLKWFYPEFKIYIINEPTKAVDIASKSDIYNIFGDLLRKGAGLIIISSDVEELLGICDRIFVMNSGKIIKELKREDTNIDQIYEYFYKDSFDSAQ